MTVRPLSSRFLGGRWPRAARSPLGGNCVSVKFTVTVYTEINFMENKTITKPWKIHLGEAPCNEVRCPLDCSPDVPSGESEVTAGGPSGAGPGSTVENASVMARSP